MTDIGYYADKAMQAAREYAQSEAYVSEAVINTVYIDDSKISNIETKLDSGLMIRIADGGRQGKASVTLNGESSVRECMGMAESVLRYSPESTEFKGYAQPGRAKIALPDVWDRRVENITPEDLREMAKSLIDSCPVNIPRAQIRVSTNNCRVINGNGVDCAHRSTLVYGHFTAMTAGEHPGEGMETHHSTKLDIDLTSIGESLARQARSAASAHEFKGSERMSMILPPGQLGDMINSSVVAAVNGENVKYGRSMWKDSLGEQVASEQLTVVDDPTVPAPLSCVFDDEGTPTEKRTIIKGGVLKSFLRDSFCGDSTGNGMRRSSVEAMGAYERTPVIKALNVTVRPGRYDRDQIVAQTDRGILVERFAWPEADGMTGRFGLNVRCGYIIRNGEVVDTVNNALLMGNMLDCVRSVELVGNDLRQMGVVTVPTISFSGTELVGN